MVLVNPGDEVIIPAPFWVSYPEMVKLAEGTPVIVPAGIEQDFKITPAQLEAAITPKTKALILCSPSNPTGSVYSAEELAGLAEVLKKHPDIIVIADEIYEHINYIGKHNSIASIEGMKDRTVIAVSYTHLFLMTFGICLFIVLMQFLWRYIDDMVGKGLGIPVLAEMFMYAALFLVPMALPLAILLASLMTFGNLGERLELLAMKSAGVSLIHIMRPLIVTLLFVSVGAFFFQNNVMPVVQVKLYTLLYSMRQKSPELDIPEGSFYKDIPGFNVYVKKKDPKDGLLKDVMIYDYSEGFNNARVIVADSGRLKTSADKLFLVLSLFNGESFENVGKSQANTTQARTAVPYRRESDVYKRQVADTPSSVAIFCTNAVAGKLALYPSIIEPLIFVNIASSFTKSPL